MLEHKESRVEREDINSDRRSQVNNTVSKKTKLNEAKTLDEIKKGITEMFVH